MEDEEHIIFDCPEYNTCRLNYPEIFLSMENNVKDLFNNVNQSSISNFIWDIRNNHMASGKEC